MALRPMQEGDAMSDVIRTSNPSSVWVVFSNATGSPYAGLTPSPRAVEYRLAPETGAQVCPTCGGHYFPEKDGKPCQAGWPAAEPPPEGSSETNELQRLRHIENMALRVASGRRKGIVTDKTTLDNLDAALEATGPPEAETTSSAERQIQWKDGLPYTHGLLMTYDDIVARMRPLLQKATPEWLCPCGAPLADSTAVCLKCFPDGMTK